MTTDLAELVIEPRDNSIGAWRGMRLMMELGGCDPAVVRDRQKLSAWTAKVVDRTGMTVNSSPLMKHFGSGELAGETVIRVTRTGSIDAHGFDDDRSATLCVFSLGEHDPGAVFDLTREFFDADTARGRVVHSYLPAPGGPEIIDAGRDDRLDAWRGMRLLMDFGDCDSAVIGSSHAMDEWAQNLADLVGMVPYGEPLKRQTGETKTVIQLIETSNIDAWGFGNHSAALCLFSCKPFDPHKALDYSKKFFDAVTARARVIHCYIPA